MNETIKLSKRLKKIATYIPSQSYFADIGSDHAYLPAYVCLKDPTVKAIAGEVRQGPLTSAKETVKLHMLTDRVDVRLGNGLAVIQDDPVTDIVIAGMGGGLISSIIDADIASLPHINRIIAQPNTNAKQVRETFIAHGFSLIDEVIMEENNHIYEILVATRQQETSLYDQSKPIDKQLLFGPKLMEEKSTIFMQKWQEEYEKVLYILKSMEQANEVNKEKLAYFKQQLDWIKEII